MPCGAGCLLRSPWPWPCMCGGDSGCASVGQEGTSAIPVLICRLQVAGGAAELPRGGVRVHYPREPTAGLVRILLDPGMQCHIDQPCDEFGTRMFLNRRRIIVMYVTIRGVAVGFIPNLTSIAKRRMSAMSEMSIHDSHHLGSLVQPTAAAELNAQPNSAHLCWCSALDRHPHL